MQKPNQIPDLVEQIVDVAVYSNVPVDRKEDVEEGAITVIGNTELMTRRKCRCREAQRAWRKCMFMRVVGMSDVDVDGFREEDEEGG